jgi:hypothetical protein
MFQLQAIYPGCIRDLDIVVVVVIVEFINDPDPERMGVSECAVIDPGYIEVIGKTEIAFCFEDRIDLDKAFTDKIPVTFIINGFFPERVFAVLVFDRNRESVMQQVLVRDRKFYLAPVMAEIGAKPFADGVHGLFAGRFVAAHSGKLRRVAIGPL